jgi:mono/diheme cytochrome c family protein
MHTLTPSLTCLRRVAAAAGLALLAAAIPAGAQERSQDQEGWRQYMVHCARCHGDDAIGGLMAPDLRSSMQRGAVDDQAFQDVVLHGRRERGMPGFKGVLTAEQVAAIQAYVAARASGKLKAGRPA